MGIGGVFSLAFIIFIRSHGGIYSEFQLLFVSGCYLEGINPSTEPIRTNPSPQPGIQASYDATYPLFNYLIYVLTLSKLMRLKGALTIVIPNLFY